MPISQQKIEEAASWHTRIDHSNTYYKEWEREMRCERLEKFFEGDQWEFDPNKNNVFNAKYVTNLFFSAIETKIPSLLFETPIFTVTPKRSSQDFDPQTASKKAKLKQDLLNTIVSDTNVDFSENIEQCAYDAFFRFGVAEVGYSANWIENPNAGKPVLKSDRTPYVEKDGKVFRQPDFLPESERVYVKSIPPKTFRVGGMDSRNLSNCSWVGYYEYIRTEDILSTPGLSKAIKDEILTSASRSYDFSTETASEFENVTKLWHIWDNRAKEKLLIPDGINLILKRTKFIRLPLFLLAPIRRTKKRSAFPIPVASQWVSPQVEYNEAREMMRAHRKRFARRYLASNNIDEDELEKVIQGGDGSFAIVDDINNSIVPIPNAQLDPSASTSMLVGKDDFNVVSATTSEIMAAQDRVTATQSVITDRRSSVRESRSRIQFALFLVKIAKEIILTAVEKFTSPVFIERFVDSQASLFQEVQEHSSTWEMIETENLVYQDFAVNVKISSMSPIANEEQKGRMLEFLAIISQYPQISMVPELLTEVAEILGFTNGRIIKQLQDLAMVQMLGQIQQGGLGQRQVAKSSPNQMEQINNQLQNQAGLV